MPSAISPPQSTFCTESLAITKTTYARTQDPEMLKSKRKIICFSDFDGTIFMQDTGHVLFDAHGCGEQRRLVLDNQIKTGERSFRDVSEEMWGSLRVPFEDGFAIMEKTLEIDPDFQQFHRYCMNNNIPFNVISAGLKPVLRKVLDEFLGEEESRKIDIVANEAEISEDGNQWKPVWRHDTELGHDKALSIIEARELAQWECEDGTIPLIVFIGDGVSDLPAASQADVLFARRGLRLEEYCVEHDIAYVPFDTFADVQKEVQRIAEEDQLKTGGVGKPARFNPRANLWRRVSSKTAVPSYVAATPTNEEKMFLWPESFSELKENRPCTITEHVGA
ncbi:2,3-diketo-5-methylthio-1-phosphopentane phosphatase [Sclerotinia borealis F-4128]|uniref:2,3-diketo-5-methylthio-1-phosphopentane phosphatase n=1 Tax=Sclerotinia borealis (strain F-4128) TaxID=1432307 RepID=W9CFJ2_SCLBF|nr:2,3-diketo-5-methylthio-1-phosphopentane phosphatase [Sclerotinia borealis F-4128]